MATPRSLPVSANYQVLSTITKIIADISRTERMTRTQLRVFAQLINVALGYVMETEWTLDKDVHARIRDAWDMVTTCDTTDLEHVEAEYLQYVKDGEHETYALDSARQNFFDVVYAGIRDSRDLDTTQEFNPNIHWDGREY